MPHIRRKNWHTNVATRCALNHPQALFPHRDQMPPTHPSTLSAPSRSPTSLISSTSLLGTQLLHAVRNVGHHQLLRLPPPNLGLLIRALQRRG